MSAPPLLEVRGLSLAAAGRCLLQRLDWRVRAGERWCVIGRNAAGKSTLLRALAGLPVPGRSGDILWLGREQSAWGPADAAGLRAYAPQQAVDRFPLSVTRLLALSQVRPVPSSTDEVLAALDAVPLAQRSVLQLSGGERQRIALAQCGLQGAPLLLLDEPVSFQDPAHQGLVARWLCERVPAGGPVALVASAHDINWIGRTATHVLAMLEGGLWVAGPAADLIDVELLRAVYGCGWREADGAWLPT